MTDALSTTFYTFIDHIKAIHAIVPSVFNSSLSFNLLNPSALKTLKVLIQLKEDSLSGHDRLTLAHTIQSIESTWAQFCALHASKAGGMAQKQWTTTAQIQLFMRNGKLQMTYSNHGSGTLSKDPMTIKRVDLIPVVLNAHGALDLRGPERVFKVRMAENSIGHVIMAPTPETALARAMILRHKQKPGFVRIQEILPHTPIAAHAQSLVDAAHQALLTPSDQDPL